jgi:membrane-associated phospholipid phosphatase
MNNDLTKVFFYIGNNGPYILLIITIYLLWNKQNLLFYYLIGFFINVILNVVLKGFFKQPRPSDDPKLFKISLKTGNESIFKDKIPFNIYGMPSGHAQTTFYNTIFIWFALKNKNVFILYCLFSLFVIYQRIYFSYHTVIQVIAGSLIGGGFAYCVYLMAQKKIIGDLILKKDDDGPI